MVKGTRRVTIQLDLFVFFKKVLDMVFVDISKNHLDIQSHLYSHSGSYKANGNK